MGYLRVGRDRERQNFILLKSGKYNYIERLIQPEFTFTSTWEILILFSLFTLETRERIGAKRAVVLTWKHFFQPSHYQRAQTFMAVCVFLALHWKVNILSANSRVSGC